MEIPAGIDKTNRRFEELAAAGDLSNLADVYTSDARILPPGSPMIQGRKNIEEFWTAAAAAMGVKSVNLVTLDLDLLGDTAVEIGSAEVFTGADETAATLKYVVKWKKQNDVWLWDLDIWN